MGSVPVGQTLSEAHDKPASVPDGRLAAVDYGTVRIGVAISDKERRLASPLTGYVRQTEDQDARWFRKLVEDEEIAAWVVGLPIFPSGDESPKSHEARKFAKWLRDETGLPVFLFDERYSTAQADTFLAEGNFTKKRRKDRRDMLAAQVILSAFLERTSGGEGTLPLDD